MEVVFDSTVFLLLAGLTVWLLPLLVYVARQGYWDKNVDDETLAGMMLWPVLLPVVPFVLFYYGSRGLAILKQRHDRRKQLPKAQVV